MVTRPASGESCESKLLDVARLSFAVPARRLSSGPAAVEKVGRSDREQAEARNVVAKLLPGGERLGHDRAHRDDRRLGVGAGLAKPVAAFKRALAPAVVGAFDLLDAAGREPQIGALAGRIVDQAERLFHHRCELVGVSRLVVAKARLAERDQRRIDRLVRTAFGPERDPAWRRDKQEAGVLVTGVVERIEAAGDERVVERADGKEAGTEQVAGEAGGGEHQEKIALGNAELDMLAVVACRSIFALTQFLP